MTLVLGVITLLFALTISGVAAYFSIAGLAVLFAGVFWPVVAMGAALEGGKLVTAAWLHANWNNPKVGIIHKVYLSSAIGILMLITALGIYGYLSKGHLEQTAPLASVELQIAQIDSRIKLRQDDLRRLNDRTAALDAVIASFLKNDRPTQSVGVQSAQKGERKQIAEDMARAQADIVALTNEVTPLRVQANDVGAKLGPVRYVADLFGWTDPEAAVRMVIVLLMLAFDPLAVALVIAATITLGDAARKRQEKRAAAERNDAPAPLEPSAAPPVLPVEEFVVGPDVAPPVEAPSVIAAPTEASPEPIPAEPAPVPLPLPIVMPPPPPRDDGIPPNPVETLVRTWDAPGPMTTEPPEEIFSAPEPIGSLVPDPAPTSERDDRSWLDPKMFRTDK